MLGLIYAHNQSSMHLRPSNRVISLFCLKTRWIIAQIVLVCHRLKVDFATEIIVLRRHRTRVRWNNANQRPLRRSRSFKVISFGINRKLICDFLLVINTNLLPILHRFRDIAFGRSKIAIFGYPCCVQLPRRRGVSGTISVNFFVNVNGWMTKVPNAVEKLPKFTTAWVGCTSVTDRQTTDDRRTGDSK